MLSVSINLGKMFRQKLHLFPVSPIYTKRPEALPGFERKNIRKAIDMILFLLMMNWLIIFVS